MLFTQGMAYSQCNKYTWGSDSFWRELKFFKNSFEDVETNKVAIFKFVPPKLETLCIDNVFDILKDGGADKWMPSIIRLTRVLRYDFSSRPPVQEKYPEMSKKGETTTTKCSLIPKILHIWRFRGGTVQ